MPTFTYERPGEIDGPPSEVRATCEQQLREAAAMVELLIEESAVQVRSAWMSSVLERGLDATPEEIAKGWERSTAAGRLARMEGVAATLSRLARRQ